jgi:hypothetical protein
MAIAGACSTPGALTPWEERACELARQDTPNELIHFIHRINMLHAGLNLDDYVGKADAERWELARQKKRLEAPGSATANSLAKGAEKAKWRLAIPPFRYGATSEGGGRDAARNGAISRL